MDAVFLFGLPNSIEHLRSRKLFVYGFILLGIGAVCMIDATIATVFGAVKTFHIRLYFNSHWINCAHILTGVSAVLTDLHRLNFFLFLNVFSSIVSIAVGVGSAIGSCANIDSVREFGRQRAGDPDALSNAGSSVFMAFSGQQAFVAYVCNAIDVLANVAAVTICVLSLRHVQQLSSRYYSSVCEASLGVAAIGVAMFAVGVAKLVLWIIEMAWLHSKSAPVQFHFLNYTCDEPIWMLLYMIAGILIILVGLRGSRILLHCALLLSALSYYPCIQYLWIDYRWVTQVKFAQVYQILPKTEGVLWVNIAFAFAHVIIIALAVVVLARKLAANKAQPFHLASLNLGAETRKHLQAAALMLILAGIVFAVSDVLNIQAKTFFRIFWPTEQKIPFVVVPTALLLLVVASSRTVLAGGNANVQFVTMPVVFVLLLQCIQYTQFHIAAYLYLSHINYAAEKLCTLFYINPDKCSLKVELYGSIVHFFEACTAAIVLVLAVYTCIVLGRLMAFFECVVGAMTPDQERRRTIYQRCIIALGAVQLLMACALVPIVAMKGTLSTGVDAHPLFVLHGAINLVCYCAPFAIVPIVQLAFSAQNLHKYPLRMATLLAMCAVRIADILMQLDYRNVPNVSPAMTAIFVCDLFGAVFAFLTVICVGFVLDASLTALPQFDFSDTTTGPANGATQPKRQLRPISDDFDDVWRDDNGLAASLHFSDLLHAQGRPTVHRPVPPVDAEMEDVHIDRTAQLA